MRKLAALLLLLANCAHTYGDYNFTPGVGTASVMSYVAPPITLSVSASSAAFTGLVTGGCYDIVCTVQCTFRSGAAPVTALTTDLPWATPNVTKTICLSNGTGSGGQIVGVTENSVAFIGSSGTCTAGLKNVR